jgi:hypothetical protein
MLADRSEGWSEADSAQLKILWQQMERSLALLSDADQLRLAGHVIVRLSELCQAKAERWLADWEVQHHQTDPLWDDQLLAGLVQKTMHLDLSDLVRTKPKPVRSKPQPGSVIGAVDKKKLLSVLDSIETEESAKQQALAVAHDEDVSAWIETIEQWWNDSQRSGNQTRRHPSHPADSEVWFSELCQGICRENARMTPVKIFLALLLGGYALEQPGGFYKSDILIKRVHSPS